MPLAGVDDEFSATHAEHDSARLHLDVLGRASGDQSGDDMQRAAPQCGPAGQQVGTIVVAQAAQAVFQEIARLEDELSRFRASSDIYRLGQLQAGESLLVGMAAWDCLSLAKAMHQETAGAFDITIGPLMSLFVTHEGEPRQVSKEVLAQAQTIIGSHRFDLDEETMRVTVHASNMIFDLGAMGKGYALDRAATLLRQRGISNALINIGGNVMALGSKGEYPWRVGIQHPREARPLASLPLRDGEAIGTSGDYQRFFELDGERYCHLLDPRSGMPARGTQAVTVLITPRPGAGTLSDAASKPVYLAGSEWRMYAKRFGIDHALRVDGDGRIEVSRALRDRLQFEQGLSATVVD